MGGLNRSSHNNKDANDGDTKLKQYMLINKQISEKLTSQRVKIAELQNSLRISSSEIIHLQVECHKWKKKFVAIRKMYIDHIQSITKDIQTNADKINNISDGGMAENDDSDISHPLVCPSVAASTRTDDSRRNSKSFHSTKNRSARSNVDYSDMDTIDEENEGDLSCEADTDVDDSENEGDTDGESGEINNISDGGMAENDDSDISHPLVCPSVAASTRTDDSRRNCESFHSNKNRSARSDMDYRGMDTETDDSENEGDTDEESGDTDDESEGSGTNMSDENEDESEGNEEESDASDDESETDGEASRVLKHEQVSQNEIEVGNADGDTSSSISDAENESGSVEQITLLTTNYDSTLKDEDSEMENGTTSSIDPSMTAQSIIGNSRSIISVKGQSANKSSLQKSLNKLPKYKRTIKTLPVIGLENDSNKNQTFGTKNVKGLVSSTPYRNNNLSNVASVEISIPSPAQSTRSRSSNSVLTMEAQVSISSSVTANGSQLSATSMSSRPKRKVAPVILSEPKLNTKLRRPR